MGRLSDSFILGIPGTDPPITPCDSALNVVSNDKVQTNLSWGGPYTVGFKYIVGHKASGGTVVDVDTNFTVTFSSPPIQGLAAPTANVLPASPNDPGVSDRCEEQSGTISGTMPAEPSTPPESNTQWTGIIRMTADTD